MFHLPSLFRFIRPALLGLTLVTALSYAAEPTAPTMLPRPLTLDPALAFALVHSPGLRRLSEQLAQQEGMLPEATARRRPRGGGGASSAYTEPRHIMDTLCGTTDIGPPCESDRLGVAGACSLIRLPL